MFNYRHYPYRYRYALGLFLFIGIVALTQDLYPLWEQLASLRQRLKTMTELSRRQAYDQSHRARASSNQMKKSTLTPSTGFDALLSEIERRGLIIEDWRVDAIVTELTMTVRGHLIDLFALLQLIGQSPGANVQQIALQQKETDQWLLKATLMLDAQSFLLAPIAMPVSLPNAVFCQEPIQTSTRATAQVLLKEYSLHEMTLRGYVSDGLHQEAWVSLPDNRLLAITPGMVIGQEQASVLNLDAHQVVVQLPNHQLWRMMADNSQHG